MKNNHSDNLISEKLGKLDALEGGVVYGKEAAWEKLQEKLERKPAIIFLPRLWLAAACVLIMAIICSYIFMYSKSEIAPVVVYKTATETIKTKEVVNAPNTTPVAEKGLPAPSSVVYKKNLRTAKKQDTIAPEIPGETISILQETQEEKDRKGVICYGLEPKTLPPVKVDFKNMKVVHNNEIDGQSTNTGTMYANTTNAIDLRKMQVEHINHIGKIEFDFGNLIRENRIAHSLFNKPEFYPETTTQEEYIPTRNFFKTIINTQN